ncbi:hypothetical protein IQ247_04050 [Plectonema cf. radiosum LEGE 06105]|uniref:Uncharacterized protein n=1 Tax=Plectonema cf. radiosum LEGE 06105 TaxID=945769 RepID=A0A8J7JTA1_9CYAN|nr:hypothetical protein [Plectonema radiosum]MBE9211900.1 hypothetical protein [Plectonema cf. radiosum LEGE 06105]
MSDKNSANQNNFKKVASGLLVLTSFVSFASNSGLANQLASNLDQFLIPAAQAKDVGTHHIAIADQMLNQKLDANSLIIQDKTAFLINQVGEKTAAPNGYYKLSDGSIFKVKDGQITNVGNSHLNLGQNENSTLQATKWRDIIDRWKQADKQDDSIGNLQQVTKQNVQETLSRIIES